MLTGEVVCLSFRGSSSSQVFVVLFLIATVVSACISGVHLLHSVHDPV